MRPRLRRLRRRAVAGWLLLALAGAALGACGGSGAGSHAATSQAAGAAGVLSGTVTVFAAASLTETFSELGEMFEAKHTALEVRFSFGGSSALAQQVEAGAPADVFAAASVATMDRVVDSGDVAAPEVFARNTMAIAVPAGNPAGVEAVADLARPGVTVALCEARVPCGAAAEQVFDAAGVEVTPVTYGQDVKAVLTSVSLGEVDAGVVYSTDVGTAGDDLDGITIPDGVNASTDYPVAVVADAPNPEAATAFAAFVTSDEAATVLAGAGFQLP